MTDKTGGPAFPHQERHHNGDHYATHGGMTVLDYFAIRATRQDIENHRTCNVDKITGSSTHTMTVEQAKYAYARAMLAARES